MKQVCSSSLLSSRNICWLRHMLPPGESHEYADEDGQMPRHYNMLDVATAGQHNKLQLQSHRIAHVRFISNQLWASFATATPHYLKSVVLPIWWCQSRVANSTSAENQTIDFNFSWPLTPKRTDAAPSTPSVQCQYMLNEPDIKWYQTVSVTQTFVYVSWAINHQLPYVQSYFTPMYLSLKIQ